MAMATLGQTDHGCANLREHDKEELLKSADPSSPVVRSENRGYVVHMIFGSGPGT